MRARSEQLTAFDRDRFPVPAIIVVVDAEASCTPAAGAIVLAVCKTLWEVKTVLLLPLIFLLLLSFLKINTIPALSCISLLLTTYTSA